MSEQNNSNCKELSENDNEASAGHKNASDFKASNSAASPAEEAALYIKNTKVALISLYEIVLKKITEAFNAAKSFCKRTYETILETFYSNGETIEV